jgi:hypothetical protein
MFSGLSPGRRYYWSVQAVDTGFAGSAFAAEQQFNTAPKLNPPAVLSDGSLEFQFTNQNWLEYDVLVSPDLQLPGSRWTNVGPVLPLEDGTFKLTTPPPVQSSAFYLLRER